MIDLKIKAYELRKDIVTLIYNAGCGHIGGDLSVIDILVVLYYKHLNCSPETIDHPDRDRFVLSKGHAAEALLHWAITEKKSKLEIEAAREALIPKPHKDLNGWNLDGYTKVARSFGLIEEETEKQVDLAREFRNLIPPGSLYPAWKGLRPRYRSVSLSRGGPDRP